MQICATVSFLTIAASLVALPEEQQGQPVRKPSQTQPRTSGIAASLKNTIAAMDRVAKDLKETQVSPEALQQQKNILSELDRLVELAAAIPRPTRTGSGDRPDPTLSKPSKVRAEKGKTNQKPSNSTTTQAGSPGGQPTFAAQRRVLVRKVWGHLPPTLQRRVLSATSEKSVPKYQRLVRKYFEALAESSRRGASSTTRSPDR